jgi:hypothetical protein
MSPSRTRTGRNGVLGAALAAVALLGAGCASDPAEEPAAAEDAPAVVEQVEGGPARITLSEAAEHRLGIRTAPVAAASAALQMPYAAVVYDASGEAYAFARVSDRTYERAAVTVGAITGDQAVLSAGPAAGTDVVVLGAAELVGVESGISGEE